MFDALRACPNIAESMSVATLLCGMHLSHIDYRVQDRKPLCQKVDIPQSLSAQAATQIQSLHDDPMAAVHEAEILKALGFLMFLHRLMHHRRLPFHPP